MGQESRKFRDRSKIYRQFREPRNTNNEIFLGQTNETNKKQYRRKNKREETIQEKRGEKFHWTPVASEIYPFVDFASVEQ